MLGPQLIQTSIWSTDITNKRTADLLVVSKDKKRPKHDQPKPSFRKPALPPLGMSPHLSLVLALWGSKSWASVCQVGCTPSLLWCVSGRVTTDLDLAAGRSSESHRIWMWIVDLPSVFLTWPCYHSAHSWHMCFMKNESIAGVIIIPQQLFFQSQVPEKPIKECN